MVCKVFSVISNLVVAIFFVLLLVTICECCGEYKKWSRKQKINQQIMENRVEQQILQTEIENVVNLSNNINSSPEEKISTVTSTDSNIVRL